MAKNIKDRIFADVEKIWFQNVGQIWGIGKVLARLHLPRSCIGFLWVKTTERIVVMDNKAAINLTPQRGLWLPNMAPRKGLALSTFVALILLLATTHIVLHQPNLGIVWGPTPEDHGLVAKFTTYDLLPKPGTTIISMQAVNGGAIMLSNEMIIEDPDQFSNYATYNAFFRQQRLLIALYRQGTVQLVDENDDIAMVKVRTRRKLCQIPVSFWLLNLSAAVCFLIGSSVWWYRRGQASGRLMALIALCYYLSILCLSIYGTRELVLEPTLFRFLSAANHLFNIIWCYALLLMFTYYPARLGNSVIAVGIGLFAVAVWFNQTIQLYEAPVHAYYSLNYIMPYMVAIALGYLQWYRTARQPLERATLRWFILTIWINIGLAGALFIVPGIMEEYGALPLWIPAFSILLMFICFAFGVLRYGLFDLERWWFTGWVWLVSGLLIAGIDLLLVYILDVGFQAILPYSILLLGWVYFPLRRWLWSRILKSETYLLEHHLPALIQSLFESQSMHIFIKKWSALLLRVFNPLSLEVKEVPRGSVATFNHGLVLQIPSLDGLSVYHLVGNRQGTRLFGRKDEDLAKALFDLSRAIFVITNRTKEVQQKGASEERERIMRDLHDDVLPKLITIKHQSTNNAISRLAEAAFQSIRDTIYILRYPANKPIDEILADWRIELAERLAPFAIGLSWEPHNELDGICLTSVQYINCSRILREAISNVLQHAGATKIGVNFKVDAGRIHMTINDNGQGIEKSSLDGMGTSNMRLRAQVLKGCIDWRNGNGERPGSRQGVTVALSFPIEGQGETDFDNSSNRLTARKAE